MSDQRQKPFPFDVFELKWQKFWSEQETYRVLNPGDPGFDASKPKFYALDMFPYPSGAGLHVGHPEGYTATDIVSRFKRMQGFNVLHPMGWDAFGLPAEQYAIKEGKHPSVFTKKNVDNFRRQLQSLGFCYDWSREINTTDPAYFKWTQWIFLQIYNSYFDQESGKARPVSELEAKGWNRDQIDAVRLAYVDEVPVNWSPSLGTVLANEEIDEWIAKGETVERRPIRQWMMRITDYAQRLIDELEDLDWPSSIKRHQRNWIGRSEGAHVTFEVAGHQDASIDVYTTRPDTLFGATYMVLAPEHALVDVITSEQQREAVAAYRKTAAAKSDMDRTELAKEKSGVPTGAMAVNPVNGEEIPVWIADYVLASYGTGAIMAVPAHDERDYEFARQFEIPIRQVVGEPPLPEQEGGTGVPPVSGQGLQTLDPDGDIQVYRRKLPHWDQPGCTYFITWRLQDSLPAEKLADWRTRKDRWLQEHPKPWSDAVEGDYHAEFGDRLEEWLDAGKGACILRQPVNARIVGDALEHFHGDRYHLDSYVVMPNHVHVLVTLPEGSTLADTLHSWKSFTAKAINEELGTEGTVWQREYYDRLVRSETHLDTLRSYLAENPKKARLGEAEYLLMTEAPQTGGTPVPPSSAVALFTGQGQAINSTGDGISIDGLPTAEAKKKMADWLEAEGIGRAAVNFKLRDWNFSRQRYWGEPFPIVWEDGLSRAIPDSELPLEAPVMEDYKPTGSPEGPLAKATDWIAYTETASRETNTMPQWAGSCWYYLRYADAQNDDRFIGVEAERYWMGADDGKAGGVDLYVGGTEHAVLHLLYSRFWHKVLHDLGHVSTIEPFHKLVNQGLILGEDGNKMSKSLGNVVNPDVVVEQYGADSLRLYEMFMGPLEQVKPWNMSGVEGVSRFLARVWRVVHQKDQEGEWTLRDNLTDGPVDADKDLLKVVHETIKKVGADIEALAFNTAISQLMVCTNAFTKAEAVPKPLLADFIKLLSPFAPHLAEEVWQALGFEGLASEQSWPEFDEACLVESEIAMAVQVNGKVRDTINVPADADKDAIEALAKDAEKVGPHLEGLTIRKVIVVPGRLVNIVAN